MKKTILLIVATIGFILQTKAQTNDTTNYYGKVNYIFQHINKSAIPTGLLQDYGIDFATIENFTGKTLHDSNWVTLTDFRVLYESIYSQQITSTTALHNLSTINKNISSYSSSTQPITFACLYYNYNLLDSNALYNHLFTVSNGQVYDVVGRSRSPYLQSSVFAIAPTVQSIVPGTAEFIFRRELFYSNSGKTISTIQIDPFGTGTYRTCAFNVPFSVNYSTAGIYPIVIKVTYTDGTINYSHTKIAAYTSNTSNAMNYKKTNIKNSGSLCSVKKWSLPPIWGYSSIPQPPVTFTADKAFMGVKAEGDYTVCLSKNNTSNTLKKPYIVVDGFDPDAVDAYHGLTFLPNNNSTSIDNGYTHYIGFDINQDNSPNGAPPILLNGAYFNPSFGTTDGKGLDDIYSYDIVYLHWHNGTDYIERNAYLLEKLIKLVNTNKTTTEKNVLVGESMGGLVVRYALRDLEMNEPTYDYQTRLFISHDAPHWGANVPVGYQAMVQYIAPWKVLNANWQAIQYKDMFPEAIDALSIFNSPAAKEMLIQRYNLHSSSNSYSLSSDNSTHTNFMATLNTMGWPTKCRNVLLSNGACDGTKPFVDNTEMASLTGTQSWTYFGGLWRSLEMSFAATSIPTGGSVPTNDLSLAFQFPLSLFSTKSHFVFDFGVWSVPPVGSSSLLFKGDVYTHREYLWGLVSTNTYILKCHINSDKSMLPLDNAPGGQEDISTFSVSENVINQRLSANGYGWVNAKISQPKFTFVPTVSSLALSNPVQNLTASFCNNITCLLPSQVSDYYAPPVNQRHISYTNDNSNWVLAEQAPTYTCSQVCPTSLSIEGDGTVCSTSSPYIITNLPAGASVTWSIPTSNVATVNPSGVITKIIDGTVLLNATISGNAICNSPVIIDKTITVGLPIIAGDYKNSYDGKTYDLGIFPGITNPVCAGYYNLAEMNIIGANTNDVKWSRVSLSSGVMEYTQPGTDLNFILFGNGQSAVFKLDAKNSCGTTTNQFQWQASTCSGGGVCNQYLLSPNPTPHRLSVNISPSPCVVSGVSMPTDSLLINQINLYDSKGTLKRTATAGGATQSNISVDGLNTGTYILEIKSTKNYRERQIFIKQ